LLKLFGSINNCDEDLGNINKLLEEKKRKAYRNKPATSERNAYKVQAQYSPRNIYTITSTCPNPNELENDFRINDLVCEGV